MRKTSTNTRNCNVLMLGVAQHVSYHRLSPMPTKRGKLAAAVFSGKIYAVAGERYVETGHFADAEECLNTVEM